jgi:sirohydrochlorin cobaltochelatase
MRKSWKNLLAASLACTTLVGFSATASAAYALNEEVKPTPALKQATDIGVLKHETPELQDLENKDAIVIMSFGTTYPETRAKTITATADAIQAAHPGVKVVTAFTSHIVIKRTYENEGIKYPTPEEALEQLKEEGYTRIALTSFDVIPGIEYAYKTAVFNLYKDQFKKMTIGTPLMYWMGQEEQRDDVLEFVKALDYELKDAKLAKDEAVLFMAHGTPHPSNAFYPVINSRFHLTNPPMRNAYVYTVEGWPSLNEAIHRLKRKGFKKVLLVPIMMVAGDHATNDMAGSEPDSHKSILEKEGFKVRTYIHGLGENPQIRQMFVNRANEAWDALQAK